MTNPRRPIRTWQLRDQDFFGRLWTYRVSNNAELDAVNFKGGRTEPGEFRATAIRRPQEANLHAQARRLENDCDSPNAILLLPE